MAKPLVLITGGSSGIGAACVREFLEDGWDVSVSALAGPELDSLASLGVLITAGDITSDQIRVQVVRQTMSVYGRIDVLINNAGVGLYGLPTEVPIVALSRLFEVNVVAPLALAQLVIPVMAQQAVGTIVTVGSVAGFVSFPWAAAYSASKSALHALHDSLRGELRNTPIQLIKVCPGIVDTDFRNNVLAGAAPQQVRDIRWVVSPEAVAVAIRRAVARGQKTVYIPRIGAVFALIGAVAPSLMDMYLAGLRGSARVAPKYMSKSASNSEDGE